LGVRPGNISVILLLSVVAACDGSDRDELADDILQPEVRQSANGILDTTLEAVVATNTLLDADTGAQISIETHTYEGSLIGPTLRVVPGDRLHIELINSMPVNPDQLRKGAFPHDPYTTNLHTHGMTVSQSGIGDNPFRSMPPQTTNEFEVEIPDFHRPGTYWYHPHKHGTVAFQFFGGMSGFLIVDGGPGTIDAVPEIEAATEIQMGFQAIRVDQDGKVPWLNTEATQFARNGVYGTYIDSTVHIITNGTTAPTYKIRPQEVQRWRMLNAASGLTLVVALEGAEFNVIANDGINLRDMLTLPVGTPLVLAAGNRADVLVKAPAATGTYLLQAIDPKDVALPGDPFPFSEVPISTADLLAAVPDVSRRVAFESCGKQGDQSNPDNRLPSCQFYFDRYDAAYWGGLPFQNLHMMRDDDDDGEPVNPAAPSGPHTNYQKEGLYNGTVPLFDDMRAGNIEEWTVVNRASSDHSFHIHQNPFLLTHINGEAIPVPEWRDTILVPAAIGGGGNINAATPGTVTFRTYLHPDFLGKMLMHCHVLPHEDFGMMQMLEIK